MRKKKEKKDDEIQLLCSLLLSFNSNIICSYLQLVAPIIWVIYNYGKFFIAILK